MLLVCIMQGTFSRAFVDYMINSEVAHILLRWLDDTCIPDESFWSTLNHNPHIRAPGAYLGMIRTIEL